MDNFTDFDLRHEMHCTKALTIKSTTNVLHQKPQESLVPYFPSFAQEPESYCDRHSRCISYQSYVLLSSIESGTEAGLKCAGGCTAPQYQVYYHAERQAV